MDDEENLLKTWQNTTIQSIQNNTIQFKHYRYQITLEVALPTKNSQAYWSPKAVNEAKK